MNFLLKLAWHDLRASGRSLWVFCACLVLGETLVAASGGLYRLVSTSLLADTRQLMGGELTYSKTVLTDNRLWLALFLTGYSSQTDHHVLPVHSGVYH